MSGMPKSFALASQGLNILDLFNQTGTTISAIIIPAQDRTKFGSGGAGKLKAYIPLLQLLSSVHMHVHLVRRRYPLF